MKTIDKRYISCGKVNKSASGNNFVGYFRNKPLWLFMENGYYDKSIKLEFPNEFYKNISCVPKYSIHKNRKKVLNFFPRETEKGDKYLFGILKNKKYYIWDVDEKYNINKFAIIYFDIKSDFF